MNNTMKRRMIAFVAAIAAVVSLSGCDDNYDETPPLAKDYLTEIHYARRCISRE